MGVLKKWRAEKELYVLLSHPVYGKEATADDVRERIAKGARVNVLLPGFESLLGRVAIWGNIEVAKVLLENGAFVDGDAHFRQSNRTPLHTAAQNRYIDLMELLLKHGADINHMKSGGSPLHSAMYATGYSDPVPTVAFLLRNGANPYLLNESGRTPLEEIHASYDVINSTPPPFGPSATEREENMRLLGRLRGVFASGGFGY